MKIQQYRNRGGSASWRVQGTLFDGTRVRKNFAYRSDAETFMCDMLREDGSAEGKPRQPRLTWLAPDELRDAELAVEMLDGISLVEAARHYRARNVRMSSVPIEQAVREYEKDRRLAGVRPRTLENVDYTLRAWIEGTDARETTEISEHHVRDYVLDPDRSIRTRADRRQILGQFNRWCVSKGYMSADWTELLPAIRVTHDLPRVLSVQESADLLNAARTHGGPIQGYTLINLFSGIRPTEARRITDADIHLEPELSCIEISPRVAKVRQCRSIELAPALRDRLSELPNPRIGFKRLWFDEVRASAGLRDGWSKDLMRHTFATYHYAMHREIKPLIYAMGNSETVLFRSYIRPVPKAQAEAFWKLLD